MSESHPINPQRKRIIVTVTILVALMAIFLGLHVNQLLSPKVLSKAELSELGAVEFDNPRIIPPFDLINQHEEPFGLANLEGQWTLMYFGFATCPDICPMALATLARMVDILDADIGDNTQIALVSVDPARDTPEVLTDYMAHFNPDFIGVTGEFLSMKRLADSLHVAFNRVVTGDDDYTVDHSGNLVIVNPYGHYHGFIRPPFEPARLKLALESMATAF